ncbi:MAG: O-antigen ligase family protein [Lishizhenia sp.]
MNKVLMSIGTIWCISNLLLEAEFSTYLKNIKKNKSFLLFLAFFSLHFIALIWTDNFGYALHDIKAKLPLLVIPLVYVAQPISKQELNAGFVFFSASLLITSTINFSNYLSFVNEGIIKDVREMSLFGSHIRYSLCIAFGAAVALLKTIKRDKYFVLWALLFAWFSFYTLKSQVFGGIIAYVFMLSGLFLYSLYQLKSKKLKVVFFTLIVCIVGLVVFNLYLFLKPQQNSESLKNLPNLTAEGNPYKHDFQPIFENGERVLLYVCEEELKRDWPKRSQLHIDSLDGKNQKVLFTLLRFLTSKKLTKDAAGLAQLSDEEINYISQGVPSVQYLQNGVMHRLYGLKFQIEQYVNGANPTGHSLLQRFEHWKAGISILKNNWIFGVGTGDVQDVFDREYETMNTLLEPDYRKRAHNQFLTFWISFGVIGAVLFLVFWGRFLFQSVQSRNVFALAFILVAIASFLPEDTLETQQGVTFIALFLGAFLGNLSQLNLNKEITQHTEIGL